MLPRASSRSWLQLCCILLLVFAQQSALTHAMWHAYGAATGHVERAGAAPVKAPPPGDAALCAFDAAYGQALGAALGSAPATLHAPLAHNALPHSHHASTTPQFLAPLSRGPPSLL